MNCFGKFASSSAILLSNSLAPDLVDRIFQISAPQPLEQSVKFVLDTRLLLSANNYVLGMSIVQ